MSRIVLCACIAGLTLFRAPPAGSPKWRAVVVPQNGSGISGTGAIEGTGLDSTEVSISIKGGSPDATYLWHMHTGGCATVGAVFGAAAVYPELRTGASGSGDAQAILDRSTPAAGTFSIRVHRAGTGQAGKLVMVACGDLKQEISAKTP